MLNNAKRIASNHDSPGWVLRSGFKLTRSAFVLAAVLLIACSSTSNSCAQNSLETGYAPSAIDRLTAPNGTSASLAPLRNDNQVVRTIYEQAPVENTNPREGWTTDDIRAIAELNSSATPDDAGRPNFIQREKEASAPNSTTSEAMPNKQHIGKLIANIGMNLAFVLLVGIGFIVISKQWFKPRANGKNKKNTEPTASSSLRVLEELALDATSTLRVIQWKDSEFLVASDSAGVRSMLPLTPTFSETLDQVETDFDDRERETRRPEVQSKPGRSSDRTTSAPEPNPGGIDDKLIQMLLDSANRSAASKAASSRSYSPNVKKA